jgi:hypothetical protein
MLRIFERIMLRMIYVPINDNGIWRMMYNNKLYTLYDELDTVKVIKTEDLSGLDTSLKFKHLILAESFLDVNQQALDV